jgi:hypothetical protein
VPATTAIAAAIPPITIGLVRITAPDGGEVTIRGMVSVCDNVLIVAFRVMV